MKIFCLDCSTKHAKLKAIEAYILNTCGALENLQKITESGSTVLTFIFNSKTYWRSKEYEVAAQITKLGSCTAGISYSFTTIKV